MKKRMYNVQLIFNLQNAYEYKTFSWVDADWHLELVLNLIDNVIDLTDTKSNFNQVK